jgi:hypothetical protein
MPRPGPAFRVTIPQLADVFHPVPETLLDPADRARRRRDRADQLAASPTPEIVQGIQDILTRIDDVQDGLVTLSLATRFLAPVVPQLAPIAKAIATGADVLNIAAVLRTAGLLGGSGKGTLYRQLSNIPNTYSARLRRTLRTGTVNPTFGELLQVLQTTDELLGIGLQLGPLMGLRTDAFFLAARGGTLDVPLTTLAEWALLAPTFFAANPWIRLAGLAGGFALSALNLPESSTVSIPIPSFLSIPEDVAATLDPPAASLPSTQLLGVAEDFLTDAALLDTLEADLPSADHAAITLGRFAALSTLAPFAFASPDGAFVREKFPSPVRAKWPATMHTVQASLAPLRGIPLEPVLPLPGSPTEVTAGELPNLLLRAGAPGGLAWMYADPYHPVAIHLASLAGQAAATLALMLEGPGSLEGPIWGPAARQAANLIEFGPTTENAPR